MKVLDAQQMREVDRAATALGIPSLVLMENAAIGVADAIGEKYPEARCVAIFCGPGNNGGDGYALARHLSVRGYECRVFSVGPVPRAGSDAAQQLEITRRIGLALERVSDDADVAAALAAARECHVVVDAVFGTGLTRPLGEPYASVVTGLARMPLGRVAVDVPSGLDAGSARIPGSHFVADLTVTFAAPKVALVLPPASDVAGELAITDLGIPNELVEASASQLHLLTAEDLAAYLPARKASSHKGDFGHLLIVAGSAGKAGAAILAARAAVRGGAGLVTAAVPQEILQTVDLGSIESMTLPLPAGPSGLGAESKAAVAAASAGKTAIAMGPGLGVEPGTREAVVEMALSLSLPLVLDADGLNAFAGRAARLRERTAPTVLTPHPGELGRLLGCSVDEIAADRVAAARRAADASGAVVVLKGHRSLIADPGGDVWINPTGNPGMASGGTGDVLTGLLGALLAQGYEALEGAQLGVFLHGLAGDRVAEREGERGMRAGDLVAALPGALRSLQEA